MLTLDELIREGDEIRAEELARTYQDSRSRIQELKLPLPVADPVFEESKKSI